MGIKKRLDNNAEAIATEVKETKTMKKSSAKKAVITEEQQSIDINAINSQLAEAKAEETKKRSKSVVKENPAYSAVLDTDNSKTITTPSGTKETKVTKSAKAKAEAKKIEESKTDLQKFSEEFFAFKKSMFELMSNFNSRLEALEAQVAKHDEKLDTAKVRNSGNKELKTAKVKGSEPVAPENKAHGILKRNFRRNGIELYLDPDYKLSEADTELIENELGFKWTKGYAKYGIEGHYWRTYDAEAYEIICSSLAGMFRVSDASIKTEGKIKSQVKHAEQKTEEPKKTEKTSSRKRVEAAFADLSAEGFGACPF